MVLFFRTFPFYFCRLHSIRKLYKDEFHYLLRRSVDLSTVEVRRCTFVEGTSRSARIDRTCAIYDL